MRTAWFGGVHRVLFDFDVPDVVGQEQVVDLQLEVGALVAEVGGERGPRELAVTQQLRLGTWILVAVERAGPALRGPSACL